MAKEARELEAILRGMGQESLAQQAGDLASNLETANILKITPKVEIPSGMRRENLVIKPRSKQVLLEEFDQKEIHISDSYSQDLIDKIDPKAFGDYDPNKPIELIWLIGRDLGITRMVPPRSVLEAGQERGYNLLRPEMAIYLRLFDYKQPLDDSYYIAMEPITDRRSLPCIFILGSHQRGLWLGYSWARPDDRRSPEDRWVFSLPQVNLKNLKLS